MNYCLGVLYEEFEVGFMHNYFSPIIKSFRETAERAGYGVRFLSHRLGKREMSYADNLRECGMDGLVIVSCDFFAPDVETILRSDFPCVTIDHVFHGHTCVMSGNRQGITELMDRVLALGHTRIACITGTSDDVTRIRQAGVLRTIANAGLTVGDEYLIHARYHDPESTAKAVGQLLALPEPPTCILMPDDISALGGIHAIQAAGLEVGKDVSVVGFDGAPLMQMLSPVLTTVKQDTDTMGVVAAEKLIERIENPLYFEPKIVSVPCSFLKGETLCPPKG